MATAGVKGTVGADPKGAPSRVLGAMPCPTALTGSSAGGRACPRPSTAAPGAPAARRLRMRCWGAAVCPAQTGWLRRGHHPAGNGAQLPAMLLLKSSLPSPPQPGPSSAHQSSIVLTHEDQSPRRARGRQAVAFSHVRKPEPREGDFLNVPSQYRNSEAQTSSFQGRPLGPRKGNFWLPSPSW